MLPTFVIPADFSRDIIYTSSKGRYLFKIPETLQRKDSISIEFRVRAVSSLVFGVGLHITLGTDNHLYDTHEIYIDYRASQFSVVTRN